VLALVTTCPPASVPLLESKLVSPLYSALMVWVPTVSVAVSSVATPPDRALVPRVVVPSLKVTVPVGVPAPEDTVAVKTTVCPKVEGFWDEATEVLEAALFTVSVPLAELEAKLAWAA